MLLDLYFHHADGWLREPHVYSASGKGLGPPRQQLEEEDDVIFALIQQFVLEEA